MARGTQSRRVPVLVGLLVLLGLFAWYLLSRHHAAEVAGPGAGQTPVAASSEPAKPAEPAPAAPAPQTAATAAAPSTAATAAAPTEGQSAPPAAAPAAATPVAAPPAVATPAPATTPAAPAAATAPKSTSTPGVAPKQAAAKPAGAAAETAAKPPADAATSAGGETSPELAQIQRLLVKLGYEPGAADGRMRAGTARAIRLFQGDVGLKVDGRPTKELLAFMRKLAGNK